MTPPMQSQLHTVCDGWNLLDTDHPVPVSTASPNAEKGAGRNHRPAKFLLHFCEICTILKHTCRCDGMVDVVDSKTSSPSVAGVGKSLGKSSVFWILFFICLSHPSCVSLQIPGDACLGVKKYICRCVGIGRRGGLKIRWANNSCGFDPRHRHQICSEVLCFGAFFYCSEAKY